MSKDKTFVERVLAGEILDPEEEFDRLVEVWHTSPKTNLELHEFLGLTWDEYSMIVEDIDLIPVVLMARKKKIEPRALFAGQTFAMAARGLQPEAQAAVSEWLKRRGLA